MLILKTIFDRFGLDLRLRVYKCTLFRFFVFVLMRPLSASDNTSRQTKDFLRATKIIFYSRISCCIGHRQRHTKEDNFFSVSSSPVRIGASIVLCQLAGIMGQLLYWFFNRRRRCARVAAKKCRLWEAVTLMWLTSESLTSMETN